MTNTGTGQGSRGRAGTVLLTVLAVPVAVVVTWLLLLGALAIPTDSPLVWFGIPMLVVAAPFFWTARKRPSSSRRALIAAGVVTVTGVLTLLFFAWLFWQFGQGMENFD